MNKRINVILPTTTVAVLDKVSIMNPPWAITSGDICVYNVLCMSAPRTHHARRRFEQRQRWGGEMEFPAETIGPPWSTRAFAAARQRRLYALDIEPRPDGTLFPPATGSKQALPAMPAGLLLAARWHPLCHRRQAGVERWRAELGGQIRHALHRWQTRLRRHPRFAVDAEKARRWKYPGCRNSRRGLRSESRLLRRCRRQCPVSRRRNRQAGLEKPTTVPGPVIAAPILVGGVIFRRHRQRPALGHRRGRRSIGWQDAMVGGGGIAQSIFAGNTLTYQHSGQQPSAQ